MLLLWLALAASLLAVVAASTVTTVRGIGLFRDAKRVGGRFGQEVAGIERGTAAIEGHLTNAAESSEALSRAVARLNASRTRLNVLLAAIEDARATVRLVTAYLPRK
jgi:hypothetical protein